MKVLMCYPQSYEWEETGRFIHESFKKQGHEVFVFDDIRMEQLFDRSKMNQMLIKKYEKVMPDIFFMLKSEGIYPSTLDFIKCKKLYWHPDVRKKVQDWVVSKALKCDKFFTMSEGSVSEYKEKGVDVHYLPEACDPNYHYHIPDSELSDYYKCPVKFIGTVRNERIPMLQRLAWEKIPFRVWGNFDNKLFAYPEILKNHTRTCLWREAHSFAASSGINITWDWCPEVELSYSARIYRVMASQGVYLCKYVKGMEKVFTKGTHCDWFNTLEEMTDKIKYYIENPSRMDVVGKAAQKEVYNKHTFDLRVSKMIEVMDK